MAGNGARINALVHEKIELLDVRGKSREFGSNKLKIFVGKFHLLKVKKGRCICSTFVNSGKGIVSSTWTFVKAG